MSTTVNNTADEVEQSGFHQAVEDVLSELPERFNALSRIYVGLEDEEKVLIQPAHPYIDSDGKNCSHLLMGSDREILEEHGFEFDFATQDSKGAGVKFWFEYVGE